ncbi:hypothetical protein ACGGZK_00070 [Agromyces sp. MMS24-K17]|uniref:hypothetical protein n=1 Tax=Agromyces sp. MMS24-K17 TaxID=3372850 RepID=UPI003753EF7F
MADPAAGRRALREGDGRERPSGDDVRLPEEERVDGQTVEADTASGGAPDPA